MDFDEFHNALRIMLSIDMHELVSAGIIAPGDIAAWTAFSSNPFRWFIRADDDQAQRLWTIIQERHRRGRT